MYRYYPIVYFVVWNILNVDCQEFGYEGTEGPQYWAGTYSTCEGKHQSPINIMEHDVEIGHHLFPIEYKNFHLKPEEAHIENNGHTAVLTMKTAAPPSIMGGPLKGSYNFVQLHYHWGSDDKEGSETTINNNSYPMELHMVFYQSHYGNFSTALEHPDGLAVLAFLYSTSDLSNAAYNNVLGALSNLEFENETTVKHMPCLDEILTKDRSVYYTYGGSLTTPPCSEVVTWIDYKNTIPLAHQQLEIFRRLRDSKGRSLSNNFRPTQPLNNRLILMVNETDMLKNAAVQLTITTTLLTFSIINLLFISSLI